MRVIKAMLDKVIWSLREERRGLNACWDALMLGGLLEEEEAARHLGWGARRQGALQEGTDHNSYCSYVSTVMRTSHMKTT